MKCWAKWFRKFEPLEERVTHWRTSRKPKALWWSGEKGARRMVRMHHILSPTWYVKCCCLIPNCSFLSEQLSVFNHSNKVEKNTDLFKESICAYEKINVILGNDDMGKINIRYYSRGKDIFLWAAVGGIGFRSYAWTVFK